MSMQVCLFPLLLRFLEWSRFRLLLRFIVVDWYVAMHNQPTSCFSKCLLSPQLGAIEQVQHSRCTFGLDTKTTDYCVFLVSYLAQVVIFFKFAQVMSDICRAYRNPVELHIAPCSRFYATSYVCTIFIGFPVFFCKFVPFVVVGFCGTIYNNGDQQWLSHCNVCNS
jgi:hypothetical protein